MGLMQRIQFFKESIFNGVYNLEFIEEVIGEDLPTSDAAIWELFHNLTGKTPLVTNRYAVSEVESVEKKHLVVSIRDGLVSAVYGDGEAVEVVVVDHDRIERGRGEGEECSAYCEFPIPLDSMSEDTRNEVELLDASRVAGAVETTEFINHYRHTDCSNKPGIAWTDKWTATYDDECPACGADISPYRSEDAETGEEVP